MFTKLTLNLEEELINKARAIAQQSGKSLSNLVAEYFKYITSKEVGSETGFPPIVKSLSGSLTDSNLDESDYKKYLESKYL